MPVRLVLSQNQYALLQERDGRWAELAVLDGGAAVLLPPTRPVDEVRLEAAIEIAEDWLMPHARGLRGKVLEVNDPTGRLKCGLDEVLSEARREWSIEEFESVFLRMVEMATARNLPRALQGRQLFWDSLGFPDTFDRCI